MERRKDRRSSWFGWHARRQLERTKVVVITRIFFDEHLPYASHDVIDIDVHGFDGPVQ
jgi:hypothetical protein